MAKQAVNPGSLFPSLAHGFSQVVVAKGSDPDAAKRLHEKAHEHCFIANSVNFPVSCDARVSAAETA